MECQPVAYVGPCPDPAQSFYGRAGSHPRTEERSSLLVGIWDIGKRLSMRYTIRALGDDSQPVQLELITHETEAVFDPATRNLAHNLLTMIGVYADFCCWAGD